MAFMGETWGNNGNWMSKPPKNTWDLMEKSLKHRWKNRQCHVEKSCRLCLHANCRHW
jgi:hypothetical protein